MEGMNGSEEKWEEEKERIKKKSRWAAVLLSLTKKKKKSCWRGKMEMKSERCETNKVEIREIGVHWDAPGDAPRDRTSSPTKGRKVCPHPPLALDANSEHLIDTSTSTATAAA